MRSCGRNHALMGRVKHNWNDWWKLWYSAEKNYKEILDFLQKIWAALKLRSVPLIENRVKHNLVSTDRKDITGIQQELIVRGRVRQNDGWRANINDG